jgi:transposase-like protein
LVAATNQPRPGIQNRKLSNWGGAGRPRQGWREDGLTTDERTELNRLRRENRVLREERLIACPCGFIHMFGGTGEKPIPVVCGQDGGEFSVSE